MDNQALPEPAAPVNVKTRPFRLPAAIAAPSQSLDLDALKAAALGNAHQLLQALPSRPKLNAKRKRGELFIQNVARGERGCDSLSLNLKTGAFSDFGDATFNGGNVVDLVAKLCSWDFMKAAHWVQDQIGALPKSSAKAKPASAAAPAKEDAAKAATVSRIWNEAKASDPLIGSYLASRGIKANKFSQLRLHPTLKHPSGHVGPAIICAVRKCGPDGEISGVHRIWIEGDGSSKLRKLKESKLALGNISGGAVFLGKPGTVLYVVEGIEKGAAVAFATKNFTAACVSANNLASLILPEGVKSIVLVGDNDEPGRKALQAAAEGFASRGLAVSSVIPEDDADDILRELGIDALKAELARAVPFGVAADEDADPIPLVRASAPAAEYPIDALGPLSHYAKAINEITQAPVAMCAGSVLAVAALAAQSQINVLMPIGGSKSSPVSLFIVTGGASGERKSSVDGLAMRAIDRYERELEAATTNDRADHEAAKVAWEAERSRIKSDRKIGHNERQAQLTELGPEPRAPLVPIMRLGEPTYEGLFKLLEVGQPSLGIFTAEGGEFIGGHAMNDEAKLRSSVGLSQLWDGQTLRRIRVTEHKTLRGRRASLHLMCQPGVLARLYGDEVLTDQGLLSRILVCAPESTQGTRFQREASHGTLAIARSLTEDVLSRLQFSLPLADGSDNELQPRDLEFSPDAKALFIDYADAIERRLGEDGDLRPIAGFANKAPEHAARIAAILTWWDDDRAYEVTATAFENATKLVSFHIAEARRLQSEGSVDLHLQQAFKAVEWMQTRWPEDYVSVRALVRYGPNSVRDADRARAVIRTLVEHRWLVPGQAGTVVAGHKAKECWRVIRSVEL